MPIYPLPVMTEEEEQKAIEKLRPPETIVISYGIMKLVGEFPYNGQEIPGCGTRLVVRTERGVEIGTMLTTTCANAGCGSSVSRQEMLDYIERSGGKHYPFSTRGKILRIATVEDLAEQSRLNELKPRYMKTSRSFVNELSLKMKIVDLEVLLSGDKVVFYFTSEERVDFRELVKRLAKEFHARIELRQVGARDEARLVADYEKCGQQCCCKQFLKVLKPVSMRSAKVQKATLDPSKISGRCGRLMCCLRYEDETYESLRKKLPPRNSRVETPDGIGTVLDTQILTQLVMVELDEGRQRNAYPVEDVTRLTGEAARRPKPADAQRDDSSRDRRDRSRRRDRDSDQNRDPSSPSSETQESDPSADTPESSDAPQAEADAEQSEANASTDPAAQQGSGRKRRRNRKRRRKSNKGQSDSGGSSESTDHSGPSGGGDGQGPD